MDTFQKEVKKLRKRDWHLWTLMIFLFLIFISFIVLVIFYSDLQEIYTEQIDVYTFNFLLVGFVAFSLLFLGYVVTKEISIKTLQGDLEMQAEEYTRSLQRTNEELENALKSLKETQAQLIQVEKMAAVGQLAAGVAHELNNPLGGILGYSQFALEKINQKPVHQFTEEDTASFLQYLKDIEQQTKRCWSIIQSLLKFSRASRKEEFEPIDVNSLIRETFAFTRHQVEKNKVGLVERLADSLPLINGHPSQLQQVFTNLILNAVQAMPKGGTLTIATRMREDLKTVEISFTDTGEGIPEENLDKIFEPFFSTKRVGEGTGLGLSVSYGLIKNHGGEIEVKSKKNQETTFTVILPAPGEKVKSESKDESKMAISLKRDIVEA